MRGNGITLRYCDYTTGRLGVMAKRAEKMLMIDYKKRMIMQCATSSKNLNPRNIEKSVSDIRIRIRFLFDSRFRISVSGCKLTIRRISNRQTG